MKQVPTLVLIERPYVFSQRSPLIAREFVEHARARGQLLDLAQLEAFHQSRTLVPLFVSLEPIARVGLSDEGGDRQLQELRDRGRLLDPRDGGYRPWGYFHRRTAWGQEPTRSFWYSFYQLLALPDLHRLREFLRPRPSARERQHHVLAVPTWYPWQSGERPDMGLVGLLTRLEPVYLPYAIQRLSLGLSPDGTEGWYARYETFRTGFDPAAAIQEFDVKPEELEDLAEKLIHRANFLDPNRSWIDLMRQMDPARWTEITGPGLAAIDFRVAAELLLSCYEDLADSGSAPPLPEIPPVASHPLHDRLERESHKLDRTLTHYGLSPHPAVVVAAEGASDVYLLRQTMDLLRVRPGRAFIDIVGTSGIDTNFDTLIRHLAPDPDQDLDNLVIVSRPPTRILRVVDAEGRMASEGQREAERARLIREIESAWLIKGGTALEAGELDGLVKVETWGPLPMEFANFTDGELAISISKLSSDFPRLRAADLHRIRHARRPGAALKDLLARRGLAKRKLDLARLLWPALERGIESQLTVGREGEIPAVDVLHRAMSFAMAGPRGPIGLRKRRSDGSGRDLQLTSPVDLTRRLHRLPTET